MNQDFLIAKHIKKSKYSVKQRGKSTLLNRKFKKAFEELRKSQNNHNLLAFIPSHPSLAALQDNNILKILEPHQNFALYPKEIQNKFRSTRSIKEIFEEVNVLRSPIDPFSFQKKLAKLKLLSVGQQSLIKNFLRLKYMNTQSFDRFQNYCNYMTGTNLLQSKFLSYNSQKNKTNSKNSLDSCSTVSKKDSLESIKMTKSHKNSLSRLFA